ncbi:MAG: VCBS repeat-containing protein, partial [Pseudomonadota bacterium]|nr:VCBS repeat-containing protein [Pseudomonadota bacterium]
MIPIKDEYLTNKLSLVFLGIIAISSSNAWAAIVSDDTIIIPYNTSYIIDVLANDQDDSLDAVLANQAAPNQLCLGDATGFFSCEDINNESWHSLAVSLGDVNQDNALDVVFANGDNQKNRICLGRGDGRFEHPCAVISADSLWSHDVALGDVNHDAQLDALFANFKQGEVQKHQLCLGHGQGSFICEPFEIDEFPGMGIALGTLDNDSELDVIFATYGRANSICLGDGEGHFTPCVAVNHDTAHSLDVALGDINADHYLDAVFANGDNQRNQVCFGNGSTNWPDCEPISADLVSSE